MRVIAGTYRSRPLQSLAGIDIRPTSDRLRETLFDILCAGNPDALQGSVWLDLFAGTGAVGIEALSRGAGSVTFVESLPKAAELIEKNLRALAVHTGFRVMKLDCVVGLGKLAGSQPPVDFVFLDPPYRMKQAYGRTLTELARCRFVHAGTIVIAEHDRKFDPGEEFGLLRRYRKLQQGDASLSFYRQRTQIDT